MAELKKSNIEEQKKDSKREFKNPQAYYIEVTDKTKDNVIGFLPFMAFSKIDTMVIFNALAKQVGIESKDIDFIAYENSNILYKATGESDHYKLELSTLNVDEIPEKD